MKAEEKRPSEKGGEGKKRFALRNIFFHNTFALIFSFCAALITWFIVAAGSETDRPITIYDVPIEVKLSAAAQEDGLQVFNQSYSTVDLEISGNSLITNKLTAEDFIVSATLNPTSTKLTGNTLQKMTLSVKAVKKNAISDYTISAVSPEEINVEFDRRKETEFPIENEVKFSAESGYYAGTPVFSADTVTVSGPESSVNKISRAAVVYSTDVPLKGEENLTCPVRLYDQNNQEITDTSGIYLSLSVNTIGVTIPILPKKTVTIIANTVHRPKGFSNSRIMVEPAQIDIAGPQDVLNGISEIQLDTPIDFAELSLSEKNVFTMDIPLPAGVRNISSIGENSVNQATVSVNLNGYRQAIVTVPEANIQLLNVPAGKEAELTTRSLEVTLIGSDAQASKLTGDALTLQVDLTNFGDRTGSVDVPVTVTVSGSGADSCWVVGKYTAAVTLLEKTSVEAAGKAVSSDVAATPQE